MAGLIVPLLILIVGGGATLGVRQQIFIIDARKDKDSLFASIFV